MNDVDELRVSATDPVSCSVQAHVAVGGTVTTAVSPTSSRGGRHDVVVLRGGDLVVIEGIQPEYPTMWARDDDLPLALLAMPAHCGVVLDRYITDLRTWRTATQQTSGEG